MYIKTVITYKNDTKKIVYSQSESDGMPVILELGDRFLANKELVAEEYTTIGSINNISLENINRWSINELDELVVLEPDLTVEKQKRLKELDRFYTNLLSDEALSVTCKRIDGSQIQVALASAGEFEVSIKSAQLLNSSNITILDYNKNSVIIALEEANFIFAQVSLELTNYKDRNDILNSLINACTTNNELVDLDISFQTDLTRSNLNLNISNTSITADGVDSAVISGIPMYSTAILNGIKYELNTETEVIITSDTMKMFLLDICNYDYNTERITINAT